jgi:hypothetical protein
VRDAPFGLIVAVAVAAPDVAELPEGMVLIILTEVELTTAFPIELTDVHELLLGAGCAAGVFPFPCWNVEEP